MDKNMVSSEISNMAKALTVFAFRNGPVEDYHANGQLSEDQMKTLNKYMVDRIALFLKFFFEGKDEELTTLLLSNLVHTYGWDEANIKEALEEFKAGGKLLQHI